MRAPASISLPALLCAAGFGFAAVKLATGKKSDGSVRPRSSIGGGAGVHAPEGRRLNRGAGVLALSVLADSGIEHYRGAFRNKAMFAPIAAASATLAASALGVADERAAAHRARDLSYALAAAVGFIGFGFHAYNIGKRPGGFSWLNFFYSAPIGAPFALALAGLLGRAAERVRETPHGEKPVIFGMPAGRVLAGIVSMGLAGTAGEAALLHFRGAFQDPFMILPVTVPPSAAIALAACLVRPRPSSFLVARFALRSTIVIGCAGVGFHCFGVARNMGGWRNWSQNVLNGPPLPAPPSFAGLASAGLVGVSLLEGGGA